MIPASGRRRVPTPSLSALQEYVSNLSTYLTYVTFAAIVTVSVGGFIVFGAWANVYYSLIPAKQDGLPDIFNGTVIFPSILGFKVNSKGIIEVVYEGIVEGPNGTLLDPIITYDTSNFVNAAVATAVGDSFQINITGGQARFGLIDRGVNGTYLRPLLSVTTDGIISGIADGPPLSALDILFLNGTVDDVLNDLVVAPIMTFIPSALPGAKPVVPIGDSFEIDSSSSVVELGLKTRGTAGTYVRSTITVTNDGVISNITSGGMIEAGDVLYNLTTVGNVLGDILGAELLTYGPTGLTLSKQLVAQGPSFFLNTTGSLAIAGLLPRGVAGTYVRPTVTYANDGVATAVADGPPLQAVEIQFGASNVETALLQNILVSQYSPVLNNSQVFEPNFDAFIFSSGNGTFSLTLRPRPMIGMTCTHPTQITYDTQFGLPQSCTSGPVPGTPTGAATLDGSGKILASQLPEFLFALRLIGLWNANTNSPFLTNASCPSDTTFYYLVSNSGNTSLGHHAVWFEGDKAVCLNGTWDRISAPQMTFNGRSGNIVPQIGDYDATLITIGNYTLDQLAGYGFVMWTASPGLPGGQLLQGIAGQTVVSGTTVGLDPKSNFPSPINVFSGFVNYIQIDHFGRVEFLTVGSAIVSIFGTPNQISATAGPNVTLSLEQDIDVNADVQFNSATLFSLVLNGKTIQSVGTNTATFPNVGAADVVMTEGAQTINGVKQVTSAIVARNAVGMIFNNAGNTFSTTVLPAAGLATNTLFRYPPTNGAAGSVLETDGAGATSWTASVVKTLTGTPNRIIIGGTPQNPVVTTPQDTHTAASPLFASVQVSTIVLNGKTIQSVGTGTATFPNVGSADVVMTAGAQTVGGTKSFSSTPVILGGGGVRLNNPSNTFSTLIRANSGLAANTNFIPPITDGTLGQFLRATGGGNTEWTNVIVPVKDYQNAVQTNTVTRTVNTFALLDSMTITTTNTATAVYKFDFMAVGSTSSNNIPVEFRALLNGTPITNQIARFSQFADEDWTAFLKGRIASVPPSSTITIEWRVVIPPGATTASVRYRTFEVLEI